MVREMMEEDIIQVAALEGEIFSQPWSEKSFRDAHSSPDNIYLVDIREGKLVGYCGIWTSFDTADLCNMAVAPELRRNGIAGELLQEAVRLAGERQVERILLEVRESNAPARELYSKYGFQKIGNRKAYYSAPVEDAILMELAMSQ